MKENDRNGKTNTEGAGRPDTWDIFYETMEKERAAGKKYCPEAALLAWQILKPYILMLPFRSYRTMSGTQEDLLQQAYLVISDHIPEYDRSKSSFKTYIFPWLTGLAREFRNDGISGYQRKRFDFKIISMYSLISASSPDGEYDDLVEVEAKGCSVEETMEREERELSSDLLYKMLKGKETNIFLNAAAHHLLLGGVRNLPDDMWQALNHRPALLPAGTSDCHPLKKEECYSSGRVSKARIRQIKKTIEGIETAINAGQGVTKDGCSPEQREGSDFLSENMQLKAEEAVERMEAFRRNAGIANKKFIKFVKNRLAENTDAVNCGSADSDQRIDIAAVHYIVEEIMGLTPAEYDAIYSAMLNSKCMLQNPIRPIISSAPSHVWRDALFDNKTVLFWMCWPEYAGKRFLKPGSMQVFHCTGNDRGNLIRAARIREFEPAVRERRVLLNGKFSSAKTENDSFTSGGHGKDVDQVLYRAMQEILSSLKMATPELFFALAKPKQSGLKKYGFVKVIEARGCYQTPLDFYMLNSPVEWQMERMEDYMTARRLAELPSVEVIDAIYEAYRAAMRKR